MARATAAQRQCSFFDVNALRDYSHRPTGVFHAMPISCGESILKSRWIRDMGDFYGDNIILAEPSVLKRVPLHMAYSVGLVDADSNFATVFVNPDRPAEVTVNRVSTNHQLKVEWPQHADLTKSVSRAEFLNKHIEDPAETMETFVNRFSQEPVMSNAYCRAFGTLYTAIYKPRSGEVRFSWPNRSWQQSFESFAEGESIILFPPG